MICTTTPSRKAVRLNSGVSRHEIDALALRRAIHIGLLCVFASATACNSAVPQQVNVCSVLASPTEFDGRTLRVAAFAHMTRHGVILVGPSCRDKVVGLEPINESVDLTSLYRSVSSSLPPAGKDVPVVLEGKFKFYPAPSPGHMLYVTKVIEISPTATDPSGG